MEAVCAAALLVHTVVRVPAYACVEPRALHESDVEQRHVAVHELEHETLEDELRANRERGRDGSYLEHEALEDERVLVLRLRAVVLPIREAHRDGGVPVEEVVLVVE